MSTFEQSDGVGRQRDRQAVNKACELGAGRQQADERSLTEMADSDTYAVGNRWPELGPTYRGDQVVLGDTRGKEDQRAGGGNASFIFERR